MGSVENKGDQKLGWKKRVNLGGAWGVDCHGLLKYIVQNSQKIIKIKFKTKFK